MKTPRLPGHKGLDPRTRRCKIDFQSTSPTSRVPLPSNSTPLLLSEKRDDDVDLVGGLEAVGAVLGVKSEGVAFPRNNL